MHIKIEKDEDEGFILEALVLACSPNEEEAMLMKQHAIITHRLVKLPCQKQC
jgi:hypothetical protein